MYDKNSQIGQGPVVTPIEPDIEEIVILDDDKDELLGMPLKDSEGTDVWEQVQAEAKVEEIHPLKYRSQWYKYTHQLKWHQKGGIQVVPGRSVQTRSVWTSALGISYNYKKRSLSVLQIDQYCKNTHSSIIT